MLGMEATYLVVVGAPDADRFCFTNTNGNGGFGLVLLQLRIRSSSPPYTYTVGATDVVEVVQNAAFPAFL